MPSTLPHPSTTTRFLDLPGLRLHLVEAGPEDGLPVILLHGFPEFWYSWRYQIPALAAAGYRVLAPDQRGYNLSDKQGPFDLNTLSDDVARLQMALGIVDSHVVGHDWGGVVAYAFAARYPQRLRKLVVMNAPHLNAYLDLMRRPSRQWLRSWYIYFFQLPGFAEWNLRGGNYRALRQAFAVLPRERMSEADMERYVAAWSQPGALGAMLGWYRSAFKQILRRGLDAPRQQVNAPTCLIWGERDAALDKHCNDTLPQYVPDMRIHYLPRASHWVQMHEPGEVNRLLLDFLSTM